MSNLQRLSVSCPQLDTLAALLQGPLPSAQPGQNDSHLTDDQFVRYSLQALTPEEHAAAERHARLCPACREESERLRALSFPWTDSGAVARLQRRIRAACAPRELPRGKPERASTTPYAVLLRPLLRLQGAFGAGQGEDEASLPFSIFETEHAIEGLHGILQRKDREFYAFVRPTTQAARQQWSPRRILLTISDPNDATTLFRRELEVGVVVLLGTDLRLTETSQLEARLLPPSEGRRNAMPDTTG